MKQDQMSMAASTESRVPFLDHVLVEFSARIPAEYSIKGLAGKSILKSAIEDILPRSIVYRQKMGFPTPWAYWLAGPQLDDVERMLVERRTLERGLFKENAIRKLFADHRASRRDNGNRIWRLLNLEIWQRIFVDGETPAREADMHPGLAAVSGRTWGGHGSGSFLAHLLASGLTQRRSRTTPSSSRPRATELYRDGALVVRRAEAVGALRGPGLIRGGAHRRRTSEACAGAESARRTAHASFMARGHAQRESETRRCADVRWRKGDRRADRAGSGDPGANRLSGAE